MFKSFIYSFNKLLLSLYSSGLFSRSAMSDSATTWAIAHQALLFTGSPRQEQQGELPFPSPGDLPNQRIKPMSPALAGRFFTTEPLGTPVYVIVCVHVSNHPVASTLWIVTQQVPLSMEFSKQQYWSAISFFNLQTRPACRSTASLILNAHVNF